MFSNGKIQPYFTAAFLEKQPRTALFQTRLRYVEEPTQLTWTRSPFCLATQKGFSADAVLPASTPPGSLEKHEPSRTCFVIVFEYATYTYYTAKIDSCQYIFEKRG